MSITKAGHATSLERGPEDFAGPSSRIVIVGLDGMHGKCLTFSGRLRFPS